MKINFLKYILGLLLTVLFNENYLAAQTQFVSLDKLINEYYKGNTNLFILEKNYKIKQLTLFNNIDKYKISSKFDFSIPYSKSIESVLQPDGNAIYTQRQYLSPLFNISASKKIIETGGEIGVSGSLGYFRNFIFNTEQYNASWVNIYINQPFFAFNEYKFERSKQRLEFSADSIDYFKNRETKLKEFITRVIDAEILKLKIKNNETTILNNNIALEKVKTLFENGRMLSIDTLLLYENCKQAILQKQQMQSELNLKQNGLSYYLNRSYNYSINNLVDVTPIILDTTLIRDRYLKYNNQKELVIDEFTATENIKRANKAHGMTATVAVGGGSNQTANQFNALFIKPAQRQNITLATSIPLTGWQVYKRNIEIATLQKDVFENNKKDVYFLANEWVNEKINSYYFLFQSLNYSKEKNKNLDEIAKVQLEKILVGKTNMNEYNITQNSINQTKIEQLDILKNILLFRFELREKTLYDIEWRETVH